MDWGSFDIRKLWRQTDSHRKGFGERGSYRRVDTETKTGTWRRNWDSRR